MTRKLLCGEEHDWETKYDMAEQELTGLKKLVRELQDKLNVDLCGFNASALKYYEREMQGLWKRIEPFIKEE